MNRATPVRTRSVLVSPAVFIALLLVASPSFANHLERHFAVQAHPVVVIHNPSGKLTIQSWAKAEVQVVADHVSDEIAVDAVQKGNMIDLRTRLLSETVSPDQLRADYALIVPQDAELQIHNDSGTVQVGRVFGDTAVDTATAPVTMEDMGGYLSVRTIGGSVECTRCSGRMEISSFTGSLRFLQNRSSNIRASTTNGNILFDSEFLPNGFYILHNFSGSIDLFFSPSDSFTLRASSLRGTVNNEARLIPPPQAPARPSRFARSMFGSMNQGLARVEVTSFDGTINIRKRE
jgi:hypothetical protein